MVLRKRDMSWYTDMIAAWKKFSAPSLPTSFQFWMEAAIIQWRAQGIAYDFLHHLEGRLAAVPLYASHHHPFLLSAFITRIDNNMQIQSVRERPIIILRDDLGPSAAQVSILRKSFVPTSFTHTLLLEPQSFQLAVYPTTRTNKPFTILTPRQSPWQPASALIHQHTTLPIDAS